MSKVLIFGAGSFAAKHMDQLLNSKHKLYRFSKGMVDVRKKNQVSKVINEVKPDYLINFAAVTTIKESFENPKLTYETNFNGTLNILNSLKKINFQGKFLNISSSEVYGYPSPKNLPTDEKSELIPMSPYSVAKIATEYLCNQWVRTENFQIKTARPFTHIGKYQSDKFSISNFCRQVAEIKLGLKPPEIKVGDISTTRDLTDVKDTVSAYWEILENGISGEAYNICSGNEISINDVLKKIIEISNVNVEIIRDNSRLRKIEQTRTMGSYEKLYKLTSWKPSIDINLTLFEMIEDWLSILSK